MKRIFILVGIIFLIATRLDSKEIPGYWINRSGDTVKALFYVPVKIGTGHPNYEKLQKGIQCFDSTIHVRFISPAMAREISFSHKGKKIRMLSRENNMGLFNSTFIENRSVFLLLVEDGKLKLFKHFTRNKEKRHYSTAPGIGGVALSIKGYDQTVKHQNYILQKDTGDFFRTRDRSVLKKDPFGQDMAGYLYDCQEVVKKIENKILRRKDIKMIVKEYNKSCGK